MVEVSIQGTDALIAKLGKVGATNVLRPPMQRAVLRIQRDMQEYPIQRVGSTYRRTGTLGRLWTTRIQQSGQYMEGKVGNRVKYAPFVQSRQFQARVHRGRWQTDERVVNLNARTIVRDFEATIAEAMR